MKMVEVSELIFTNEKCLNLLRHLNDIVVHRGELTVTDNAVVRLLLYALRYFRLRLFATTCTRLSAAVVSDKVRG